MFLLDLKKVSILIFLLISLLSIDKFAKASSISPLKNNIQVPINQPPIPESSLLLTNKRIEEVIRKINQDSEVWNLLTKNLSHYFSKRPYNSGEYSATFALAYYVSGDERYIKRAKELLIQTYFSQPDIGWEYYTNRNLFRENAKWAIMGYSWIKDFCSEKEKKNIESILYNWSKYWLYYIDYSNDFQSLRIEDTDEITSLTHNLTLLGVILTNTDFHIHAQDTLYAADSLLNRFVVNYFMRDIMKGGAWAEGSDYSPGTQIHWIQTFLINKESRDIEYPINYAELSLKALLHQTLANGTGVYKYGSEEKAQDYDKLSDDYRYEFALNLMAILKDVDDIKQIYSWFNQLILKEGHKKGSMVTYLDRLLYHDPNINNSLDNKNADTFHYAEGVGLIASRSDWSPEATNLFFINRNIRVDHEHKDALSFDLAYQGEWISKEVTGYGGKSQSSRAHNTILIENADSGSSSPTQRPAGSPFYYETYNDDNITLISADATNSYNMSGYFSTNYTSLVNRQIAFIKPSTVIIYDHVKTNSTQTKDLVYYSNIQPYKDHKRWVKIIQHLQLKPIEISQNSNTFKINSENSSVIYQVHAPMDAQVRIVDEKELWKDELAYSIPNNQKRWHFEVSNKIPVEDNEFITSFNFAGADHLANELVLTPIKMTKENGLILEGNITGLAVQINNIEYILLFNKSPQDGEQIARYNPPKGFENAIVYGLGVTIKD